MKKVDYYNFFIIYKNERRKEQKVIVKEIKKD